MTTAFTLLSVVALKGLIVLGAAWAIVFLLRGRSAAARHLVWTAAAAALLALPLLSVGLPSLHVQAPTAILDPGLIFRVSTTGQASGAVPATGPQAPARAPSVPFDPRRAIVLIWAAGVALGLVRMLYAWVSLCRIRRSARMLSAGDIPVLDAGRGRMPLAFGIFRPVILLPSEAGQWSEERRAIVLRHELAHIERGDLATHLLARLALTLNWWNPLAWLAWREFLKERERAADDLVLASGARASDYAAHLLEIARAMQPSDALASAAIAMARPSQLEGRLLAILDSNVNRRAVRRSAPALAAIAAVVLIAPLAAVRAQDSGAAGAASLVKQGELAERNHQRADADTFYAKAAALGDFPETIPALIYLGRKAQHEGNPAAAQGFFERAFNIAPSGPYAGSALNQLAGLKLAQGNEADAEALYQRALKLQEPGSSAVATTMQLYALLLRQQNRSAEADDYEQKAREIYRAHIDELTRNSAAPGTAARRVGGGVTAPSLLYKIEPFYTEEARAAKFQGTVLLYVEIGPDGLAHNISVKRGLGMGLDEKAIEAVRQWKFKPGTVDGQPISVAATIEVNFRLM